MIITRFPNSRGSAISFSDFKENLGKKNIVVMARHNHLFTSFKNAPFSLKTTICGRETYRLGERAVPVDADTFLLVNKGRNYESIIKSDISVASYSLFFREGMAAQILGTVARHHEENLDTPDKVFPESIFLEQLVDKKGPVAQTLKKVKQILSERYADPLLVEELFYEVTEALLQHHQQLLNQVDELSSIKKSTRLEIFRRLSKARMFIHAHYAEDLVLKDLAAVAHMSEYHFLRMFKSFYATTPHQYITERRIFKVKEYLTETEYPIKKICRKVGYNNVSSFSRLFKKNTGVTPSKYRSSHN